MSIPVSQPVPKSTRSAPRTQRRFHQATFPEQQTVVATPRSTLDRKLLGQLLPANILTQLAHRCSADDERRRKLTCVVFFWMAVLAFGPGGPITLHSLVTCTLVAHVLAGCAGSPAHLSKEAVSENFRERPWQFFEAVFQYLLITYAQLWRQLANAPRALVVEHLHVLLMDATIMRVANQLFAIFPARANRRCKRWAAIKLHVGLRLFRSVPEVVTFSTHKKNEHQIDFLRPRDEAVVYIFDLGYWTYALFDTIIERGQHFLSRLREDCNPPILDVLVGDPHWVGQRLKTIALTGSIIDLVVRLRGSHPTHPQMHHDVRLVGRWVEQEHAWHLYVTSLLDPAAYPVTLLVDLYRLRWQIEIFFRNLKCVLRIANFVSITENGIRLQLYAALIHYVLTQLIILKAMHVTGRPWEDFSIPYCLDAVQQVLHSTSPLLLQGSALNWDAIEAQLLYVVITNGLRPNRKRAHLITQVKNHLHPAASLAGGP